MADRHGSGRPAGAALCRVSRGGRVGTKRRSGAARSCSSYASWNPPNSGEFGYAPNQPLGVSPRFPSETDAHRPEACPLSGPSGRLSPRGE